MQTNSKLHLTVLIALTSLFVSACAPAASNVVPTALTTNTTATTTAALSDSDTQVAATIQTLPVIDRSAALAASSSDLQADLIGVYQQANPAVVYIIVPDVDPYRFIGLSLNNDSIPACILKHGCESSSEIAPGKPFDGRGLDSNPLDLCPSRSARGKGPR